MYFKNNIISKPDSKTINAVDFINFSKDLAVNLNTAKGGIIFIDEVHKLVPAEYVPGQTTAMDKLYVEMEKQNGDPLIILSSRPEGFNEYLEKNPEVKKRFNLIFKLPDLTAEEMFELAQLQFKKQNFKLETNAEIKLTKLFRTVVKKKDSEFGNGHDVNKIVNEIIEQHFLNPTNADAFDTISENAIKGKIDEDKTTEQIFEELNQFIGMTEVKSYIRNMIGRIEVAKRDAEKTGNKFTFGEHLILTGNPGTGKTTLARKLGEIFSSIGLLQRGHVIEVDRPKMISEFKGGTAKIVEQRCNEAMDGILFIDEAYTLKQDDNDNYGQEAIDTILTRMENDRGKFMVIAAGYENEMQKFINSNPGLKSRFKEDNIFNLKDYTPKELLEIFKVFVKKDKLDIDIDAENKLYKLIQKIYEKRDKKFGNGRDIRNLYEKCLSIRASRLNTDTNHDLILYSTDIPTNADDENTINIDEVFAELNNLTGLNSVKKQIYNLIDYLEIEKLRSIEGGKKTVLNTHFIFKGNPGTGKTTVAGILGKVFKAIGLLPKGNVVEASRKDLVGKYIGDTEAITGKKIDEAIGGILFIDEAYTLLSGGSNDYGQKAIEIIMERMEKEKGKFIVIAAGYNADMERFLDSNPGLPSRFKYTIQFEDYSPEEMTEIFKSMVEAKGMVLESDGKKIF